MSFAGAPVKYSLMTLNPAFATFSRRVRAQALPAPRVADERRRMGSPPDHALLPASAEVLLVLLARGAVLRGFLRAWIANQSETPRFTHQLLEEVVTCEKGAKVIGMKCCFCDEEARGTCAARGLCNRHAHFHDQMTIAKSDTSTGFASYYKVYNTLKCSDCRLEWRNFQPGR